LVLNGYSDWYLPSLVELQAMYSRLHLQGLGGFGGTWYWSSSQGHPDHAWNIEFGTGHVNLGYHFDKNPNVYYWNTQVRAVRAF
jgi:hypothetical protein